MDTTLKQPQAQTITWLQRCKMSHVVTVTIGMQPTGIARSRDRSSRQNGSQQKQSRDSVVSNRTVAGGNEQSRDHTIERELTIIPVM